MPVPPNQRRKTASVMTLPSGEGDPVVDRSVLPNARPGALRVTGMPRGGRVYFNGNELTGIGWADPVAMTAYDVEASGLNFIGELTITDANGVVYRWPDGNPIDTRSGASYFNFNEFVRQGPTSVNLIGLVPVVAALPTRRSITDVSTNDSLDRSNTTGVFSITGVPTTVVSLIVKENARVLPGTLAGGTWTASSFDVSDAATLTVTPTVRGTGEGIFSAPVVARPLTRTVAIPAAGLSIAYSTLAAPPLEYREVGSGPPAMTGIMLVGDINSIGGATFSLDGVAVPYAPGAAQWLPTTPAYTKLFIPAPAGAHVVRLIKGGRTLMASATVAANLVTDVPVSNMTVETQGTTQQLTDTPAVTGIVLVGDINSIGGATFSLDGVAVPYAPGAAQWLPTTPAYTKLFIPAPAGARVVRLIKGGQTLVANATVAAGQVTEIPVTGMMLELMEIQKADDQKDKSPVGPVDPGPGPIGPGPGPIGPGSIGPPPVNYTRLAPVTPPGMSTTSKLIIGGLVAAALGGGYYWYSMQPKANPGKKGCGCGCGGKSGCG